MTPIIHISDKWPAQIRRAGRKAITPSHDTKAAAEKGGAEDLAGNGRTDRLAKFDPLSFMTPLLRSEIAEREVRSVADQMTAARFPAHRNLQGIDVTEAKVDESLVQKLYTLSFLGAAPNLVFIEGSDIGKTQLANQGVGASVNARSTTP